ncbi:RNA polymerase sigma-70 factor [Fulvivirga lutea]|uniref:RNA polymerase sigma-70 factor n=1 Tax=Fulvivirga lutea TaxID=2810512 RepID=A0A974WNT0_9BACT|nr:RNA polymerase sigma-70 factor [Fulvivirga lutea]QSE98883.1 RNA polymerase sigma-70 factor [Fulvivirga lutea]
MTQNFTWSKIKEGDEQAFKSLYDALFNKLIFRATYFLESKEEAEDVIQNVFLKLWKSRENLEITGSIEAYLNNAVKNSCLNKLERKKTRLSYINYLSNTVEPNTQQFTDPFFIEKLNTSIDSLPEKCKEVFIKSRFKGRKNKEIAQELNISIKTVENQMGKALSILRDALIDYLPVIIMSAFLK